VANYLTGETMGQLSLIPVSLKPACDVEAKCGPKLLGVSVNYFFVYFGNVFFDRGWIASWIFLSGVVGISL